MNYQVELTSEPLTSTAGLTFIGQHLNDPKFESHLKSILPHVRKKGRISDFDIVRSMIGLLCVGKPHFDAVAEYKNDPYFTQALGLEQLPSPEILRQRLQKMPEKTSQAFQNFNVRLLGKQPQLLSEKIHKRRFVCINVDASPMDNSGSKKEGVGWTYKNYAGYCPIFAYIGPHGFMLDNELREGSAHCNRPGTSRWFEKILDMGDKLAGDVPRLVITDAGHDSSENVELFTGRKQTEFLVKRNMRTDDPQSWLELAQKQSRGKDKKGQSVDMGAKCWFGERELALPGNKETSVRVVFRAIRRYAKPDGQFLLEPQVTIEAWWTSLDWSPQQIYEFYKQRGTSEQYHSELKSDLAMERLPSGKFLANQHLLHLGMIAFNLLRLLGQQALRSGLVPGRKSKSQRLRLRSVMQNLMYMAGRIIHHARRCTLRIFEGHGWAESFMALARAPG